MTLLLRRQLFRLLQLLTVFAVPAYFMHQTGVGLFIGLLVFVVIHLQGLHHLHVWLKQPPGEPPPEDLTGIWEDIADTVYRLRRNEDTARANLLGIIARARTSISALDEAVVMIDSQGNLEWWNPAAERLLGFKDIDAGKPVVNLIRDPAFIRQYQNPTPDGLKLPSWVHANRFLQFELTRFGHNDRLLIAYDITRLQQLEQIRTDFVANVSHELRTPLTVLSGYLETLSDHQEDIPPRWGRALKQMQQQATRMTNLVNDLLLLSRLEGDSHKAEPKTVAMPPLLEQLRTEAQAYDPDKEHRIVVQAETEANLVGTEADLRSAFSNLVTNAIKYTPPRGEVVIRWYEDERNLYFSVKDSGIGIEARHIPRLTERFYRVDAARSSATGGTGLGLAIVKHVLLQHGATLNIDSAPGKGSTFSCVFPKAGPH
ncbi:PAS/PAC sensor signal transduction histidine kinase [Fluviicoccus keumensis]|uniref:Phosphate regulon sensor protein PhoR n=1 Tax=Fluviicoccus keumensis TaxID=1435465 RepID=A0A4Q7ZD07_9GAMM|nr:phosphate regulon sensor histidine kinase PhoR [Fluviicoccus keumensis]RZU47779.1 PAS/PAC sensor signal transduction histidine kinase [Fluviicoccus keumensis]